MLKRGLSLVDWLINLFNPPPLAAMSPLQKLGRAFLLSATLIVGSILVAMLGAVGMFIAEKGRELHSTPQLLNGIGLIVGGIVVNAGCVWVLVQIKHADHKLIPPSDVGPEQGAAIAKSQMKGK
jgi:hypothetical protein